MFNFISDVILGSCIRNISSSQRTLYLTFDDGPNSYCTAKVLDLLKKHNCKASFFVISDNIEKNIGAFNRINNEGHAIGNHSSNHNTATLFQGYSSVEKWISQADKEIQKHSGKPPVGFRPPVGVRTPEIKKVMTCKNQQPIMWQHRFYDTRFKFTEKRWKKKIKTFKSGDIILLHDTHKDADIFIASLEMFIKTLLDNKFELKAIPNLLPLKEPGTK